MKHYIVKATENGNAAVTSTYADSPEEAKEVAAFYFRKVKMKNFISVATELAQQ
jgi:hypothetical protein